MTFFALILFFISCNKLDQTLLHGTWKGAAMLEKGKQVDKGAEQAVFQFFPNQTYTYEMAYHKEAGRYRTVENKLYTTDTTNQERLEKVVRVSKLTTDSLYLEMNMGGIPQVLQCYKAK